MLAPAQGRVEVHTILLTDDEAGVRLPLRRILEDSGYRVLEAGGGEEALAIADELNEPIDLLLTDVVMPGMSGDELARRVTGSRPAVKVLFMSGYSQEAVMTHGQLVAGSGFLPKPFSAADLVDRVQETLSGSTPEVPARRTPPTGDPLHSRK